MTCVRKVSSHIFTDADLVFMAVRPTIIFDETFSIVSSSISLLALSVEPVDTRSTMSLDRPRAGAISMATFNFMHSAWMPWEAKCLVVKFGYLVATLTWLQV